MSSRLPSVPRRLRHRMFLGTLVALTAAVLMACFRPNPFVINLMPAPDVYSEGVVDPFLNLDEKMTAPTFGTLYATDRAPAPGSKSFYANDRGFNVRLGIATTELGTGDYTWEEARRISLLKNRTTQYPVKVTGVEEFGMLDRTISVFTPPELIPDDPKQAAQVFAQRVNEKLARSTKKEVYVYLHGYNVEFSNPILVASELWHFLGYDGVMIAYSWPSTPSTLSYGADLETTAFSAHDLRIFLEYLAEETDAEKINLIAYSAGTRVAIYSLAQAMFMDKRDDKATIQRHRKIGRVVLVGSDFDRQLFAAYLVEGLLKVPQSISVYVAKTDWVLGMSKRVFGRERLGHPLQGEATDATLTYLANTPELQIIDATGAEGVAEGTGHQYFRSSPLVSSDVLVSLLYNLDPAERGLVQEDNLPIWKFPDDYVDRLRATIQTYHKPDPSQ